VTKEEKAIVEDIIAKAWDDGFEHCRRAAIVICLTSGRPDVATLIESIPLVKPAKP
jgi:hypothetical protein